MSLFGPIWQSRNKNKIDRYIQKSQDEKQLAEIATKCVFRDLRLKAARSLSQSEQISYVVVQAVTLGDEDLALSAAENITDDRLLANLVKAVDHEREVYMKNNPYRAFSSSPNKTKRTMENIAWHFFCRIRDEDVLYDFVKEKGNKYRYQAVQGIRSRDLLLKIGSEPEETSTLILKVCGERTQDPEILSRYAFTVRDYTSDKWKKDFSPLLTSEKYGAKARAFLEKITVEEEKEVERKNQENQKKQMQREKARIKEEKEEEFLKDPLKDLAECAGKKKEASLWKKWYTDQLGKEQNDLLYFLSHRLNNLSWSRYFPAGAVADAVQNSSKEYLEGKDSFSKEEAERDLRYILTTLYQGREELRDDILALDDVFFYKGRTVGVYLPRMQIAVASDDQSGVNINLKEIPWISEDECRSLGGHFLDDHCVCTKCGAVAHDWEEKETQFSVTMICRRCGEMNSWQTYW